MSCSFCHGQNGEGLLTKDGDQFGPPLTDVGAAAVDFQVGTGRMPAQQPGAQAAAQEARSSTRRRPPPWRRTSPRSAPARRSRRPPTTTSTPTWRAKASRVHEFDEAREASVVRGGQIFLTNCTACHNFEGSGGAMPRGGAAPKIRGVDAKHIYEAMLTGPQSMDTFSNGNLPPDAKRDVIAYLNELDEQPSYGGWGSGGLGPVARGYVGLADRDRPVRRLRGLDRLPLDPLDRRSQAREWTRERRARRQPAGGPRGGADRQPRAARRTPGGRPTSTRSRRGARSVRSPPSSRCR